ncbi:hypothetical protein MKW98_025348 [Papaver atlanticum]|uniref:Uncharacterized protein n=1 Tax=Papaver atlanticum TaxID=357466 RepID=A0AAD4S369_9MAGN|nr:hypothetical protein MKW98_025348 [Papaver atlanticum]
MEISQGTGLIFEHCVSSLQNVVYILHLGSDWRQIKQVCTRYHQNHHKKQLPTHFEALSIPLTLPRPESAACWIYELVDMPCAWSCKLAGSLEQAKFKGLKDAFARSRHSLLAASPAL